MPGTIVPPVAVGTAVATCLIAKTGAFCVKPTVQAAASVPASVDESLADASGAGVLLQLAAQVAYALQSTSFAQSAWLCTIHADAGTALPTVLRHVWHAALGAWPAQTLAVQSAAHG